MSTTTTTTTTTRDRGDRYGPIEWAQLYHISGLPRSSVCITSSYYFDLWQTDRRTDAHTEWPRVMALTSRGKTWHHDVSVTFSACNDWTDSTWLLISGNAQSWCVLPKWSHFHIWKFRHVSVTTRWPKIWHNFLYAVILSSINRFSKLFHYQNQ